MKILLTGEIGSGKSTAVRKVLSLARFGRVAGLLSLPVDEKDRSRGHRLLTLPDRRVRVFAFPGGGTDAGPGRFRVDRDAFDRFGAEALRSAAREKDSVLLIDELGIFERDAARYVEAMREAAAREGDAIVVVQKRALDFWLPLLRAGGFDQPEEVTPGNRDRLPVELAARFTADSRPDRSDGRNGKKES